MGFYDFAPTAVSLWDSAILYRLQYIGAGIVIAYAASRYVYLSYFHPLAGFPGPKIASVSNIWYAYHCLTGRYPWAIENALKKYGDFVRIAPNEVVFGAPQSYVDMYGSHVKSLELFTKTEINDFGDERGGLVFERDPVQHRKVAKQISPAFSSRSITAKEHIVQEYIDYFVEQMKISGDSSTGIDFKDWTNWLAMDISADITYSRKLGQMRDRKNSPFLSVILGFNAFSTVSQVSRRFPTLSWLKYLVLPFSTMSSVPEVIKTGRKEVKRRLDQRQDMEYRDYFEQLMPSDGIPPSGPSEMRALEQLVTQMLFAQYETISTWWYSTLFYLVREVEMQQHLAEEIRSSFERYEDIVPSALGSLKYLEACLNESLRLFPSSNTGLPRESPGASVDGVYLPKGVYCQTCFFATHRNPKYFFEPRSFRPQRWLTKGHPQYDPKFSEDNLKAFVPFSYGPRGCPGKEMAWMLARLFVAKVLWTFDLKGVPTRPIDFEKDFPSYGFFVKPELMVKFSPVSRKEL